MTRHFLRCCSSLAAAAVVALPALAQVTTTLPPVTVTGRTDHAPLAIGGFGDLPLARTPLQASVVTAERMRDIDITRLSDLSRIDPSVGEAYSSEGYWDSLTVRGFVLDNRFNYRRDGLPINAETQVPLDNKERLELLKGLSGMQAGTSAPGGLVNLVVKRPLAMPLGSATLGWRESGSLLGAIDLNQRIGTAAGLRINAAYEHLDPQRRSARGHRHLLAVAGELQAGRDLLVEAEVETSHRSQPSQAGFSLLGSAVPDAERIDPRISLNNQPWTLPVVFDGNTASIRLTRRLAADWTLVAHFGTQRLASDDRIAFPFGCSAEGNVDRYCSDGSFDLYEFVSDNERRRSDALDLSMAGRVQTGAIEHRLQAGLLRSKYRSRLGPQIFDFAGIGNIDGTAVTPRSTGLVTAQTNRDEDSTELYLRDALRIAERTGVWLGVRHTRLERNSLRTDGAAPTALLQSFTTPWLALSHELASGLMAYASWGRGVESEVTPNLPLYSNAGQALPALQSRQVEAGIKASGGGESLLDWGIAAFDIERPLFADAGTCSTDASCTRQLDGAQHHLGIEANVLWRPGAWTFGAGALALRARRDGSVDAALNGLRPTNVAERSIKALASYAPPTLPGLTLQGSVIHEGDRMALPDNSARIAGWTRLDAAVRYEHRVGSTTTLIWRIGIDNVADRRAWKEAPFQFGHAYLFALPPRSLRLSLQADL